MHQQTAQRAAEFTSAEAEVTKLRRTQPLIDEQLEARRHLTNQGSFARLKLLEYEQQRIEHIRNVEVQLANATRTRLAYTALEAESRRLRETLAKTAVTELPQARDKAQIAGEDLRKAVRRREMLQLRAPVAGTVQQLAVATIGGVVQPARPLMVIVPDGAEIEVEAHLLDKEVGFVRVGQPVRVKLEAFPFTEYGLVPGLVEGISRDAIDLAQSATPQQDDKGRPLQSGLVYAARIRLLQTSFRVRGRDQPFGPGLSVQAEIKTGERPIIQYLLSPITRSLDEAGPER
nr:HlyD family type I secretion periplasmic adaptor subunit [Methylobacterium indicum]